MNDIVKNIESWFKFLADLFREPEIIDALAAIEKRKPGTLAKFKGDKLIDEGEPLQENVVSDTSVAETPVAEVPVAEHPRNVIAHLVNGGGQRNIGIPSEVTEKLIKDKLNINITSEESKEESNITVVPPEPPQVEEPVIQSLPDDVVSTGDTAPIQETQEAKPEVQPLPGVDVSNEQNVNNQSVENTVNNDASSLSDVDVPTTAADMANKSISESENQAESLVNTGKTLVKNAVTDNNDNSSMTHLSGSFGN